MPTRKVSVGAFAGALTVVLIWGLGEFAALEIPPEVASALTTILTFGASYLTPDKID